MGTFFRDLTEIQSDSPAIARKGRLLSVYFLLAFVLLGYVILNNLYYIREPLFAQYLFEDFIVLIVLFVLWRMNKRGNVWWAAIISLSFSVIFTILTFETKDLEYVMIVLSLPVAISSFVLTPRSSFMFASISWIGYTLSSISSGIMAQYNLTAVLALFALAFMVFIISRQLERSLEHNERLLVDLQRSNYELKLSYETTLDGWSQALDLRDRETEGHTRRVTDITLRIAKAMGFSNESLEHVRRGALLHDIGKLGVPDHILHKTGELNADEWVLMKKHPVYAYELLYPIMYLRDAIDIPYCHHERWDGGGYPRGLSGENIPLAARIFAVVDVYDALISDRPYRKAWPIQQALEYIKKQSGSHFDPRAVDVFIKELQPA